MGKQFPTFWRTVVPSKQRQLESTATLLREPEILNRLHCEFEMRATSYKVHLLLFRFRAYFVGSLASCSNMLQKRQWTTSLTAGTYQIKQSIFNLPKWASHVRDICTPDLRNRTWIRGCTFHEHTRGSTKVMPCIFFSETLIIIKMKLAHVVGMSFTQSLLHYKHTCTTSAQLLPNVQNSLPQGQGTSWTVF